MDPMEAIKQTYFQECEELLLAMEEGLIAMESGEADSETINAVFRAVHSIKGSGGAFGFDALVRFAHQFETVLDHIRSGTLSADAQVVKILLRAGDNLADHVAAARSGTALAEGHDSEAMDALAALADADGAEAQAPADFDDLDFAPVAIAVDAVEVGPVVWSIRFFPHAELYANANEPLFILRELKTLGTLHVHADLSRLPELDQFDPAHSYCAWDLELKTEASVSQIEEAFEFVIGDCELEITAPAEAQPMDDLAPTTPVLAPSEAETPVLAAPPPAIPTPPAPAAVETAAASTATAIKPTIRVDLDKVDRLVNLVGELVITQAMLAQRVLDGGGQGAASVVNGLGELEHLLRELQESVMAIRTQPVKSVFQRMPRLVREVAAQTGKQVRIDLLGEATEVDKTVIDRLGEPLTHMIRNAIDHGIETPQARTAAGKPEEGCVRLSAEHRGGRIIIELSDDGRGIDRARVKAKAIEKGLIPPNAALSDDEIDNLIFLPGFSTASEISNISGRGVGMDVVRRNIIELGGRIIITSIPGCGSRFCLTLPLTLAVLDGMVVAVGEQTFVLPLTHIVESLQPKAEDIRAFGHGRALLHIRNTYVPLVDTGELLGTHLNNPPSKGVVILVESEGAGRLALLVDAIVGQQQVVIKSFEGNYQRIEGIAGATILGDGRVALILDVDGLVTRCRSSLQTGGRTGLPNEHEAEISQTGTTG